MLLTLDEIHGLTLLYSPRTTTEVDFFLTHLNNALSTYKSIACTIFVSDRFFQASPPQFFLRRRRLNISSGVAARFADWRGTGSDESQFANNWRSEEGISIRTYFNESYNWNELTWNGTNVKRSVPRR